MLLFAYFHHLLKFLSYDYDVDGIDKGDDDNKKDPWFYIQLLMFELIHIIITGRANPWFPVSSEIKERWPFGKRMSWIFPFYISSD